MPPQSKSGIKPKSSIRTPPTVSSIAEFGTPDCEYYSVVREEPSEECFVKARAKLEPLERNELIGIILELTSRNIHLEDRAKIAELEWARAEGEVRSLRSNVTPSVSQEQVQPNNQQQHTKKERKASIIQPTPNLLVANEIFERFHIDSDAQTKFYESRKLNFTLRQLVLERFVNRAHSEAIMAALQNKPFKGSQVFVQCLRSVESRPIKPVDDSSE